MSEFDKIILEKWIETKERLLQDLETCEKKILEYQIKTSQSSASTARDRE